MCAMAKGQIVSCQIAYYPIGSVEYDDEVKTVLQLIEESGLDCNIGQMSTTIKGPGDKVMDLIALINKEMSLKGFKYTMNILLSNICGCHE